jgi:arginyl-tRNA synthetase
MLEEPQAVTLLRILAQYTDMVTHALKTLEPSTIPNYLFRLAHHFSSG